jgi:hypothetical protein
MSILTRFAILAALLGLGPGEFVFAQAPARATFNRFTKLDAFVLETGAGESALKHKALPHAERRRKVLDGLRAEARAMLGGTLKAGEENFLEVLASEAVGPLPAPVPPPPPARQAPPRKEWLDVAVNGQRFRVWGWKNPANPNEVMYIPGDHPGADH